MQKISSSKLCEILQSQSQICDCEIANVSTDSRKIRPGDLFVALRGENFDGHNFVAEVVNAGAALAVVEHLVEGVSPQKQVVVKNTTEALGELGAYNRSFYKGFVIGLTGSAGKTTTKEEIKFMLSHFAKTYATAGNFNNQIGVPQSLLDLDMESDYAVIEMGMSAKGEIEKLVSYVKPDMAIVTNVYPMHIEFFENFEGIAHAKAEIFSGLKKGGYALINEDTNFTDVLDDTARRFSAKVEWFGKNHHPDVAFTPKTAGEHVLYNGWCALRVAELLGLDVRKAAAALENFEPLAGRGKMHKLKFSKGVYTLIDDSYSGQPEAMKFALETLGKMEAKGRKVAVLGKMAELGSSSTAKHIEIGKAAAAANLDVVIGVCPEMKDMLAQIPENVEKHYFENKEGLDEFLLNNLLQNNDIVLIKGARYSSKLYQVTEKLLEKGKLE